MAAHVRVPDVEHHEACLVQAHATDLYACGVYGRWPAARSHKTCVACVTVFCRQRWIGVVSNSFLACVLHVRVSARVWCLCVCLCVSARRHATPQRHVA